MKALDTFHLPPFNHNCAQAVAHRWRHLYAGRISVADFAAFGGGRAPGGRCGALYAAMVSCPAKADEIERLFAERCGGTCCHELKGAKKTPCATCVDTADKILENLMG